MRRKRERKLTLKEIKETIRDKEQSRKQVLSILEYLKEIEIPCNVTLTYWGKKCKRKSKIGIPIDLNNIPLDIINGKRDYQLMVEWIGVWTYYFESYIPSLNDIRMGYLKHKVSEVYSEEQITNFKRKKKLDDILNDNQPIKLE